MNVLIVDVGGTHVKLWHSSLEEFASFESGDTLPPEAMVSRVLQETANWKIDVIALGLPCRVIMGRPVQEPQNLELAGLPSIMRRRSASQCEF
jgi:polyphosphate glucokinase